VRNLFEGPYLVTSSSRVCCEFIHIAAQCECDRPGFAIASSYCAFVSDSISGRRGAGGRTQLFILNLTSYTRDQRQPARRYKQPRARCHDCQEGESRNKVQY